MLARRDVEFEAPPSRSSCSAGSRRQLLRRKPQVKSLRLIPRACLLRRSARTSSICFAAAGLRRTGKPCHLTCTDKPTTDAVIECLRLIRSWILKLCGNRAVIAMLAARDGRVLGGTGLCEPSWAYRSARLFRPVQQSCKQGMHAACVQCTQVNSHGRFPISARYAGRPHTAWDEWFSSSAPACPCHRPFGFGKDILGGAPAAQPRSFFLSSVCNLSGLSWALFRVATRTAVFWMF